MDSFEGLRVEIFSTKRKHYNVCLWLLVVVTERHFKTMQPAPAMRSKRAPVEY